MATVLTSWKSVAQYMGTGVRTVQRWTTERGFPVRGTGSGHKRLVIATTEEIDEWVRSQSLHGPDINQSELDEALQERIASLQSEIGSLRLHIDVMEMRREIDENQHESHESSEDVLRRSVRLLEMSSLVQKQRREVLDHWRTARMMWSEGIPLTLSLLNGPAEKTDARARRNNQLPIDPVFLGKQQSAASMHPAAEVILPAEHEPDSRG